MQTHILFLCAYRLTPRQCFEKNSDGSAEDRLAVIKRFMEAEDYFNQQIFKHNLSTAHEGLVVNEAELVGVVSPLGYGKVKGGKHKSLASDDASSVVSKLTEDGLDKWGQRKKYLT